VPHLRRQPSRERLRPFSIHVKLKKAPAKLPSQEKLHLIVFCEPTLPLDVRHPPLLAILPLWWTHEVREPPTGTPIAPSLFPLIFSTRIEPEIHPPVLCRRAPAKLAAPE
jgi:hypothetical protein